MHTLAGVTKLGPAFAFRLFGEGGGVTTAGAAGAREEGKEYKEGRNEKHGRNKNKGGIKKRKDGMGWQERAFLDGKKIFGKVFVKDGMTAGQKAGRTEGTKNTNRKGGEEGKREREREGEEGKKG
jgi:hypothetical protein